MHSQSVLASMREVLIQAAAQSALVSGLVLSAVGLLVQGSPLTSLKHTELSIALSANLSWIKIDTPVMGQDHFEQFVSSKNLDPTSAKDQGLDQHLGLATSDFNIAPIDAQTRNLKGNGLAYSRSAKKVNGSAQRPVTISSINLRILNGTKKIDTQPRSKLVSQNIQSDSHPVIGIRHQLRLMSQLLSARFKAFVIPAYRSEVDHYVDIQAKTEQFQLALDERTKVAKAPSLKNNHAPKKGVAFRPNSAKTNDVLRSTASKNSVPPAQILSEATRPSIRDQGIVKNEQTPNSLADQSLALDTQDLKGRILKTLVEHSELELEQTKPRQGIPLLSAINDEPSRTKYSPSALNTQSEQQSNGAISSPPVSDKMTLFNSINHKPIYVGSPTQSDQQNPQSLPLEMANQKPHKSSANFGVSGRNLLKPDQVEYNLNIRSLATHQGWVITEEEEWVDTLFLSSQVDTPWLVKRGEKSWLGINDQTASLVAVIPAGWTAKLQSNFESWIAIDLKTGQSLGLGSGNTLVNEESLDKDRLVLWKGVPTGTGKLSLSSTSIDGQESTTSLAFPLVTGTVTDLGAIKLVPKSMSITVLDGSKATERGLEGVWVKDLQTELVQKSSKQGQVAFLSRWVVDGYPQYFDLQVEGGFRERIEIEPEQIEARKHYLSSEQINRWLGQIEGGLKPESAILIGAFSNVDRRFGENEVMPRVRAFGRTHTGMSFERYTLNSEEALMVSRAINLQDNRVVSVEIPTGPNLFEFEDRSQRIIQSRIFYSSPSVVNLIED